MAATVYPGSSGYEVPARRGAGFPPASASPKMPDAMIAPQETGACSTGKGGIAYSLKLKAKGTHDTPGVEKTNNLF